MDSFPDDVEGAFNNRNSALVINDQVQTMCSTMHKYCSGILFANVFFNSTHMTCAHLLHNCAEHIRAHFKAADNLTSPSLRASARVKRITFSKF